MANVLHEIHEASAGTGKTHLVVEKVLELLTSGVSLDQILIVTYTEKAAGELLDRLRRELITAQRTSKNKNLEAALDAYDNAQVFTIHAFCLGILRQFPYDHGGASNARMVSDKDILRICMRDIQRHVWPKEYSSSLTAILLASEFGDKWEKRLLNLAGAYRPACDHDLLPKCDAIQSLDSLNAEFARARAEIAEIAKPLDSNVLNHWLYKDYGQLGHRYCGSRRDAYLAPVLLWAADTPAMEHQVASFVLLAARFTGKSKFKILTDDLKARMEKAEPAQHATYRSIEQLVEKLERMREKLPQIGHALMIATAGQLAERAPEYKSERGLQSFEDFLTRVAEALVKRPTLIADLRKRYQAAIVDEFQDTDPLQWKIFESIFVEGAVGKRLILVGDPKQAIYAFRNADLETYLKAREKMSALHAGGKPLTHCYRATPQLLEGLNAIFGAGFFDGARIEYELVKPPDGGGGPAIVRDDTGRKAVTAVSMGEKIGAQARRPMAWFIGAEIERLLNREGATGTPLLEWRHKNESRKLLPGDIAVLLFAKRDALPIEEELRLRKISYSFYKKSGIWQSDEAIHLHYVLAAIAGGGRAAFRAMLLTRCFGMNPGDAARLERSAETGALFRLFTRWRELGQHRRWAELFRSILFDSGVLYEDLRGFGGERRVANFIHISNELSRAAYRNGMGMLEVLSHLQQNRLASKEDESNLQPAESDRSAVQLTTIHAAKGLEFPVVFLAGGYTFGRGNDFLKYHDKDDKEHRLVLNLDDSDANIKKLADDEVDDEYRRLLYVALTRAMLKLYVPLVQPGRKNQTGPLAKLLTPALEKAKDAYDSVDAPLQSTGPKSSAAHAPQSPRATATRSAASMRLVSPLLPHLDVPALAARRLEIQSFSRLIHTAGLAGHTAEPPRPPHQDDDEPKQYLEDDLPPGASAGEALHNILENIHFSTVKNAQASSELLRSGGGARKLIEQSIARNLPLTDEAGLTKMSRRAAEIVWNTLHTPIPALGNSPLCTLPIADRLHELEFHMPVGPGQPVIEELKTDRGFVTGWMDLVFRHADKFYLLDWKSNALAAYAREDLARDMAARRYDLQYRIYLEALRRWLKRVRRNFDEATDLGGVFYIYMRGMSPSDPSHSGNGIFFEPQAKG